MKLTVFAKKLYIATYTSLKPISTASLNVPINNVMFLLEASGKSLLLCLNLLLLLLLLCLLLRLLLRLLLGSLNLCCSQLLAVNLAIEGLFVRRLDAGSTGVL